MLWSRLQPKPDNAEEVLNYMNVATNQIANRFSCFAITLEMPFKDCWSNKDPEYGWTPARSRKLGATVLEALEYIHPYLRAEGEWWKELPHGEDDRYVSTTDDYQAEAQPDDQDDGPGFKMLQKNKRFYSDVRAFAPNK